MTLFFYIFLQILFILFCILPYISMGIHSTWNDARVWLGTFGRRRRADKEIFVLVEPATPVRLPGGDARARGLTRTTVHW